MSAPDLGELRAKIVAALEQPVHAPMSDHHVVTGECQSCPWPLHMVESPAAMADAILPALLDDLEAARADADKLRETAAVLTVALATSQWRHERLESGVEALAETKPGATGRALRALLAEGGE